MHAMGFYCDSLLFVVIEVFFDCDLVSQRGVELRLVGDKDLFFYVNIFLCDSSDYSYCLIQGFKKRRQSE